MLGGSAIDEHIGLGRDNGRVDESQKEEAADKGTDDLILSIWVFSL